METDDTRSADLSVSQKCSQHHNHEKPATEIKLTNIFSNSQHTVQKSKF